MSEENKIPKGKGKWHGGKGSARKESDQKKYNDGWDRIFGKNKKDNESNHDKDKEASKLSLTNNNKQNMSLADLLDSKYRSTYKNNGKYQRNNIAGYKQL